MKNVQFENDILRIPEIFRTLNIIEADGENFLKGTLNIVDRTGKLWDIYEVEIKGSEKYPYAFPKLFETANAFPKIVDWHVNENTDKSCCVDVTPNEIIICKEGLNIANYINLYAIPYFANQTYRRWEGYYLYGEYSHGILGRLEFYQSKLKAKNPAELLAMFDLIIKDYNPDRRAYCPFCHKVKFRHCHRNAFKELQIVKGLLAYDGLALLPFFRANPDFKLPMT
jgi:hypothetical protein